MAIARISELEQYSLNGDEIASYIDGNTQTLDNTLIEISKPTTASESRYQSMNMRLPQLSGFITYQLFNLPCDIKGTKTFKDATVFENNVNLTNAGSTFDCKANVNFNNNTTTINTGNFSVNGDYTLSASKTGNIYGRNINISASNQVNIKSNADMLLSSKTNIGLNADKNVTIQAGTNTNVNSNSYVSLGNDIVTVNSPNTIHLHSANSLQIDAPSIQINDNGSNILLFQNDNISAYGDWIFYNAVECTANHAKWSDLAEFYSADKQYEPGTLVSFGGDEEITVATTKANAVVTSKPGFVMNSQFEVKYPVCVALTGRVPVKVKGHVDKFDYIIMSDEEGIAAATKRIKKSQTVLGRALETKETDNVALVLCTVQLSLV